MDVQREPIPEDVRNALDEPRGQRSAHLVKQEISEFAKAATAGMGNRAERRRRQALLKKMMMRRR